MKGLPSRLCVICDVDVCRQGGWSLVDFAAACLQGGARFLQLRAKTASSNSFLDDAIGVVERSRASGALVVVNDRADIARIAGAGGVHIGQMDLGPRHVRTIVGPEMIIGLSTHTDDQYDAAIGQSVNYAAIGPVFSTATKSTGYETVGLERVRHLAARDATRRLPLVAIGGITLAVARSVIEAGADSVAVISDLLSTGNPEQRVRQFLRALE